MLGERQVAAPLMASGAAYRALMLAYRGFQPGEGVGVHLARLWVSGQPWRPAAGQFGHQTPVLVFALRAPAAPCPGQHGAMRRQRARQVAPIGHPSTVRQQFARPVLRDDQEVGRPGHARPAITPMPVVPRPVPHGWRVDQAGIGIPRYTILVVIGVPVSTVRPTVHSRSCDLLTTSGKMARAWSPSAPPGNAIW
jgi:hypothetical protein